MSDETPETPNTWPDGESEPRREILAETNDDALIIDLDGFEGPLDLLLYLVRAFSS